MKNSKCRENMQQEGASSQHQHQHQAKGRAAPAKLVLYKTGQARQPQHWLEESRLFVLYGNISYERKKSQQGKETNSYARNTEGLATGA